MIPRIGATERPPEPPPIVDSGRVRTGGAGAVVAVETAEEPDTFRDGEKDDMAEPGLGGRVLAASVAFFCAIIASRREGFELPKVLFDSPRPGLAGASAFFGELGLLGSFCKSLWAVASRPFIILG